MTMPLSRTRSRTSTTLPPVLALSTATVLPTTDPHPRV